MLPTIPFKKHVSHDVRSNASKKSLLGNKQNSMQHQTKSNTEHVAKNGTQQVAGLKIKSWMIIASVLFIAMAGIAILRLSRASGGETAGIPASMFDIQNKVSTLLAQQPSSVGQTEVGGYAEFHYSPVTTEAVKEVVYYLDGRLVGSSSKSPYSFVFDSSRYQNDNHVLTAVAFDANNTPIAATRRTLAVDNSGGILQGAKKLVTYPWYALFNL